LDLFLFLFMFLLHIRKSIKYRTINVNIVAWIKNPDIVGQPFLLAKPENIEFINLYVYGLKRINRTNVVYNVYLHLSADSNDFLFDWVVLISIFLYIVHSYII